MTAMCGSIGTQRVMHDTTWLTPYVNPSLNGMMVNWMKALWAWWMATGMA